MTNALDSYIPSVSPLFRGSASYSSPRSILSAVSKELSVMRVSPSLRASVSVILILSCFSLPHTSLDANISCSHGLETIRLAPPFPANLVIRISTMPDLKLVLIVIIFLNCGGKRLPPPGFCVYSKKEPFQELPISK